MTDGLSEIAFDEPRRKRVQTPACDRCTRGVMDMGNPHLWGECDCPCHGRPDYDARLDYPERFREGPI